MLGVCASAQAQLVLTIDTANETFSFSGTTTGTPAAGDTPFAKWQSSGSGSVGFVIDLTSLFSDSISHAELSIKGSGALDPLVEFVIQTAISDVQSFTATGAIFDYSGRSAPQKALINKLANFSGLTLTDGTGFEHISIVSAVPEPSSYAAMLAGMALVVAVSLRRSRSRP